MAKHPRAKLGDVIAIPLDETSFVLAQVIAKTKLLYLSVYPEIYDEIPKLADALKTRPALAGWTADAEIHFGRWPILGNAPVDNADYLKKRYLVNYIGEPWVENFEGDLLHKASKGELDSLYNRSSYSPAAFEHVIRAFSGLENWQPNWDRLVIG